MIDYLGSCNPPNKLTMRLKQRISHTVDLVNQYFIIAFLRQEIFGFEVKVGECQCAFFPNRQSNVPHARGVSFVVHRPVLGLNNSCFLFGRHATTLDF